jgi:hypothetical protein
MKQRRARIFLNLRKWRKKKALYKNLRRTLKILKRLISGKVRSCKREENLFSRKKWMMKIIHFIMLTNRLRLNEEGPHLQVQDLRS